MSVTSGISVRPDDGEWVVTVSRTGGGVGTIILNDAEREALGQMLSVVPGAPRTEACTLVTQPARHPLARELEAFGAHWRELCASPGKYALVHGDEVITVMDTEADAIRAGYETLGHVPFLVKRISVAEVARPFMPAAATPW